MHCRTISLFSAALLSAGALCAQDVSFRNLGYVIIDEQHRFGVQQREALRKKGNNAAILSMTATPIPRSLALTLFADYSVSVLRSMPKGRIPVRTYLVSEGRREGMYSSVGVEFQRGHQAYFVYPRIGDEGESDLKDVISMYDFLKKKYPDVPSALIHSRLPDDEKMSILRSFREKKLMYLVATSVIEVGIDIPDATCMVIEHAERFGLAALHQLRGRVGRSTLPSYCFLAFTSPIDLEIRGPGEIMGEKQSGFLHLRFATLTGDIQLVEEARNEAERIVREDRGLLKAENAPLRMALKDMRSDEKV